MITVVCLCRLAATLWPGGAGLGWAGLGFGLGWAGSVKKQSIICAGFLQKKTGNRLTGVTTWKDRYFVLDPSK